MIHERCRWLGLVVVFLAGLAATRAQVTVNATLAATGLSGTQSNSYNLNFTQDLSSGIAETGPQRSYNGDPSNQRSARAFIEFQVTSDLKAAASSATGLTFSFYLSDLINNDPSGNGLPDLVLNYYGATGSPFSNSSSLSTWWTGLSYFDGAVSTGVTSSSTGLIGSTVNVSITGLNMNVVLNSIAGATVGDYAIFGLFAGPTDSGATVTSDASMREVYIFDSNSAPFSLTAIPEPSTWSLFVGASALAVIALRRKTRRPFAQN